MTELLLDGRLSTGRREPSEAFFSPSDSEWLPVLYIRLRVATVPSNWLWPDCIRGARFREVSVFIVFPWIFMLQLQGDTGRQGWGVTGGTGR